MSDSSDYSGGAGALDKKSSKTNSSTLRQPLSERGSFLPESHIGVQNELDLDNRELSTDNRPCEGVGAPEQEAL